MLDAMIWLVPAAVLAAGLYSPRGGLLVLAACLPLFGSPPGGPYLGALDVAALVAIATAWRAGSPQPSRLGWPIAAFFAVSVASLFPLSYQPPSWSPPVLARLILSLPNVEPWTPLYSWRALANLAIGLGLYLAIRRAFGRRSPQPLFLALAAGLGVTLVAGLLSHAELLDLGAYRVKGGPLWQSRLHSFFFHSGWLAEFIVLAAPVGTAALVGLRRKGTALGTALGAVAVPTVFLTEQRGAWFSALAQILLIAPFCWPTLGKARRRPRPGILAGLTIGLALTAGTIAVQPQLYQPAIERARSAFDSGNRLLIWKMSAEMVDDRPILGWGLGHYSPVFRQAHPERADSPFDILTAHNHYLMLAVQRGAAGLAAFALVCWALVETLRGAAKSPDPGQRRLARGLALSLAGALVYGFVQYLFFLKMIEWLFWILLGAAALLAPRDSVRSNRLDRVSQSALLAAALLVPWRVLTLEPLTAPGDRSFGWHRQEAGRTRAFQWTERYAARRIPWTDAVVEIDLANGHPRAGEHRTEVVVRIDGKVQIAEELSGGWKRYPLRLGPKTRDWALLEVAARPAFRPFSNYRRYPDLPASSDIRSLGVAVSFPERSGSERVPETQKDHGAALIRLPIELPADLQSQRTDRRQVAKSDTGP